MGKKLTGCFLIIIGLWLLLVVCCVGMIVYDYEPMTEEERAAYEASRVHEYPVMSVFSYMAIETNQFGAVSGYKLRYCFTYIGDDGQLHQFDDFTHTKNGLWKVCVGDENKYVVKDGLDTLRWLYLTEETLKNMQHK